MQRAPVDQHGQPLNRNFCAAQNLTKSILSLQGILKGVVSDQRLNDQELLFLQTWLASHKELPVDGDVLDIVDTIEDILADGVITVDELNEIKGVINDVLEYGELVPSCVEDLTNELLGFLSGVAADNVITLGEFNTLVSWFNDNPDATTCWPGNDLYNKLAEILEDGLVEQHELDDLVETCKLMAGQQFLETGVAHGMATEFCATKLESLPDHFETICFTGKFLSGTRMNLQDQAKKIGLRPQKDVTQSLHLLVIGGLASRDWRFSSHGRKIEKALENQQKGLSTVIITEDNWKLIKE
ncbi:hypothetical protein ABMY44_04750 [Pseudoalteromonas sp. Cnat2-41]|uniref:NAD-dependent DNA ligase n=1 Tax=unclassified Pseudoalteromonas TaxID=194690 RepID=UPI001EF913F3|nr:MULTISPECIES: NAD-dependent DNA ligase [unclassified Pseudoalteromonas]MCF2861465.1 NAD-dependent DNA ligase [Pseudoalteromonas sp. CNAT2-18]MCG7557496.1 NAD-dependent DNA ligase [Pseudoalteromonas sp. CNAT2-18.1]